MRPGSPPLGTARLSAQSLAANCSVAGGPTNEEPRLKPPKENKEETPKKKGAIGGGDSVVDDGCEQSSDSESESEHSSESARSDEDSAPRSRQTRLARAPRPPVKRARVVGRQWVASLSARSNQDGQRRFEERAARLMRAALARRAPPAPQPQVKPKTPAGGVYARLEAEWRERHVQRPKSVGAARPRQPANKYK